MVEDTATGKISSPAEAVARQREFVKLVEQQLPKLAGLNELLNWANGFIAQAKVIPDTFTTADMQELVDPNFIADTAESADSTIDVIDDFAVTFQNMQEILTPGFGTIGNSAQFLTKNLLRFGKAVSGFFGGSERFDEIYNEGVQKQIEDHLAVVNEKNIDATIQVATQNIDSFEQQKEQLLEDVESAKNESETGELSADEQATVEQNLRVLDEQLEMYRNYHKKLLEKKKQFASKEAEVKEGSVQ